MGAEVDDGGSGATSGGTGGSARVDDPASALEATRDVVHDRASIWVRQVGDRVADGRGFGPVVGSGIAFSWVPVVLTLALYTLTAPWDPGFVAAHLLAMLFLFLAPMLIAYYDAVAMTEFFEDTKGYLIATTTEEATLDRFIDRVNGRFADRHGVATALSTLAFVGVYVGSPRFAAAQGIAGPTDPAWWVYFAIYLWAGLIIGPGFHGIFNTLVSIHEMMADDDIVLSIDPLHRDGLGGLSTVGRFAIRTTMLASSGALALPLAFEMTVEGGLAPLVYTLVLAFTVFILASFVYPTYIVHRKADRLRKDELDARRREIRDLRTRLGSAADPDAVGTDDLALRLEIRRLRDEYEDYRDVRLYPVSIDIVSKLAGSVLLPVFFLALELGVKWAFVW